MLEIKHIFTYHSTPFSIRVGSGRNCRKSIKCTLSRTLDPTQEKQAQGKSKCVNYV